MYRNLDLYTSIVTCCKPVLWWELCKNNPRLIRSCKNLVTLLTGGGNLNAITASWGDAQTSQDRAICSGCGECRETLEHFIFHCNINYVERQTILRIISTFETKNSVILTEDKKLQLIFGKDKLLSDHDYVEICQTIYLMYTNGERYAQPV